MAVLGKIIYKPIGIVLGLIAGLLASRVFQFIWSKIDDEEPPGPTTQQADWSKVLAAAAVQGMVFKTVRTVVGRYGAQGFHHLTGVWPGERRPDPK